MARPEVVVGVDGSPESRDALRCAFEVVIFRTRKPPPKVRREVPKSIREHS